jgi:GTPase SAR1 family protein
LVFDITNSDSFYSLFQWIDQYNYYNEFPKKNIVIAGNKHDLEEDRAISRLEIQNFCNNYNCDYIEISVLEDKGVDTLLLKVIEKCMELQDLLESQMTEE